MTITVKDAEELLGLKKETVSQMAWKPVKHRSTLEYHAYLALAINGETIESFRLLCTFSPLIRPLDDCYSFSLIFNNQRIYALDKENKSKQHRNSLAGYGREHYGKLITGTHEHTWSDDGDGYGYAEPFTLGPSATHRDYWNYVAGRTNITLMGDYSHPQDGVGGQISLFGGG